MRGRHRRAIIVLAFAVALDLLCGLIFAGVEGLSVWQGWYWAIATATTVGYGDITPHTTAGHWIAVLVMLTVVPLFAATFSLITAGITSGHVETHLRHVHGRLNHIIDSLDEIPPYKEDG